MTPIELKQVRCVLLDIDGTLVDSNDEHARAWQDVFAEAGRDVGYGAIRRCIGMGSDNLLAAVKVEGTPEELKALGDRQGEVFKEHYLPKVKPFPAVRELLDAMAGRGLMLIVATSSKKENAEQLLEIAGVADIVDEIVTAADAENSKPDPDIVHAALARAQVSAEEARMLGDTPYDIESAQKAGVSCVGVCSGGWSEKELEDKGAIAVYRDVADILARFDDSPFGKARPVGG